MIRENGKRLSRVRGGDARWPARRFRAGRLWKGMDQKIERRRR
jgi:hypothetical protein